MKKSLIFALGAVAVLSLGACKPSGVSPEVAQQRAIAIKEELKTKELPTTMAIESNMNVTSKANGQKETAGITQKATFTAEHSYYHLIMEAGEVGKMEMGTFVDEGKFYLVDFTNKEYTVSDTPTFELAPFDDVKEFVTQAIDELILFTKEDAKAIDTILNEQLKDLGITIDASSSQGEFHFYSNGELDLMAELSITSAFELQGMKISIDGDIAVDVRDCLIASQTIDLTETLSMQGQTMTMDVVGDTTYSYNVKAESIPDLSSFAKLS